MNIFFCWLINIACCDHLQETGSCYCCCCYDLCCISRIVYVWFWFCLFYFSYSILNVNQIIWTWFNFCSIFFTCFAVSCILVSWIHFISFTLIDLSPVKFLSVKDVLFFFFFIVAAAWWLLDGFLLQAPCYFVLHFYLSLSKFLYIAWSQLFNFMKSIQSL